MAFRRPRRRARWFWSNGSAWGTVLLTPRRGFVDAELRVER